MGRTQTPHVYYVGSEVEHGVHGEIRAADLRYYEHYRSSANA